MFETDPTSQYAVSSTETCAALIALPLLTATKFAQFCVDFFASSINLKGQSKSTINYDSA